MMRRKHFARNLAALAVGLLLANPALAQEEESDVREKLDALRRGQIELQNQIKLMQEVEELKKGQAEIRKELDAIKKLLQQQARQPARSAAPAGPNVRDVIFDLGANPVLGENTAKLTLLEFTDYQ